MMTTVAIIFILVLLGDSLTEAENCGDCKSFEPQEDVDWTRMKGHWYDTMNVPRSWTPVNCFDWTNITAVDDGFTSIIQQRIAGESFDEFKIHYIRKNKGIYVWDKGSVNSFVDSSRRILRHMKEDDVEEYIQNEVDFFLSMEYMFFTDYQTYFATVICTDYSGWESWITHPSNSPSASDVAAVWNTFHKHGISGHLDINTLCLGGP